MKTHARVVVIGGSIGSIGSIGLSIGLAGQRLPVKVTVDCLHYPENKRMRG
jgi:D-serine dehydratase